MKSRIFGLLFFLVFSTIFLLANHDNVYATSISVSGKAKVLNTNNSYLNFTLYNSNVNVDDSIGIFSGYAWLEDMGWVAFGTTDNTDGPVTLNLTSGAVTGKAKVLNTGGFLYFTTKNSNVAVALTTGVFSGYVWSEDVGWIDFTDTGVSSASFLPTPTPTLTPTNTPTTSSSSSSSNNSAPSCGDAKPSSIPDLFQINVNSTTAKLFFTPISNSISFYLSFSTRPNAEDYGAETTLAREGVQNFTISLLKPNTTYYFKVRGQNGCMPGDWSNIMKVTTRSKGIIKTTVFYKKTNIINKIVSKAVSVFTPKKVTKTPTLESIPTIITQTKSNTTTITPPVIIKKRCFLWWCF